MSVKTEIYTIFGNSYKTTQFTAIPALEIMKSETTAPLVLLSKTSAMDENGEWTPLDSRQAVNKLVKDPLNMIAPRAVLSELMQQVDMINFGFLLSWHGVKIPSRFASGRDGIVSQHVDPIVSQIIQNDSASMRELEEYYSLEDALKMVDVMAVKGLNTALAHEDAERNRPKR
jgi:hypothetical protein